MEAYTTALPTDFGGEVRLFPLSNLVLFPGIALPLHIFESRYKEMLEDALAGDELVAMATLTPGFEHDYYSRPPISPMVCIGRVLSHEKTPQGTYNLMLAGLERAWIQHEIEPVRAYRRAKVCTLGGLHSPADTAGSRQAVRLAEAMLSILPAARPFVEELLKHDVSLAALTDFVSFHLPLATELKLRLLAEPNPGVRAELLLATLSTAKSATSGRHRRPADFSDN
jgi:ATP-dependent Lon protease